MARFNPFPPVASCYGAPMGRANTGTIDIEDLPHLCVRKAGGDGYYDQGGAYWGASDSEGPVWAVWPRGEGRLCCVYVRAHHGLGAIAAACELPNWFYDLRPVWCGKPVPQIGVFLRGSADPNRMHANGADYSEAWALAWVHHEKEECLSNGD